MNLFQTRVLQRLVRGVRASTMSVPTILFCMSLALVFTIPEANGQTNQNGETKKGIMCYVCNSARDPRCGDPFDPSTIEKVDCEQFMPNMNTSVCRKNVQRATLGSRVDYRVVRTCGYMPESARYTSEDDDDELDSSDDRCYNKAGTFEVQVTYCSCYTDGCNPAPRQAQSSFTMASQAVLQIATMIAGSFLLLKESHTGFY